MTEKEIKELAYLLIFKRLTIRQIADIKGISKSNIHKKIHDKLKFIDSDLYQEVKKIFKYNTQLKHIRGGIKTKAKYIKLYNNLIQDQV